MEFPALPLVLDLAIYGILFYILHQCVFRFPKFYGICSAIFLVKVGHTLSFQFDLFWTFFRLTLFTCLLLTLFLTRKSANFFWLLSGLLLIKSVDISLSPIIFKQKGGYYLWVIFLDALTLFLIDRRTLLVSVMALVCRGELQRWAKAAAPHQRESYHEVMLMLIYWGSILYSVFALVEYVVYHYYDWPPGFFYKSYSLVKTPLVVFEMGILFYITTGRAVTLIGRQPMH